ncbi:MAG TPA: SsrA-binding protein SmpB [bacterium]|nr:SsrA-binding protein SmpB [bacterium]HPP30174.1 SsrA-binding protein SmpB [bacterium]
MRIENRKAYFNYEILEKIEAGLVLRGPEVKSLREGKGSIKEAFGRIENGEVFIHNFYIAPYPASFEKPDPLRKKKLLLGKREIKRLSRKLEEKGLTLIPLAVYFNKRGLAKVEIALAKGKKLYDKREKIKERDVQRDIERRMKQG